MSEIREGGCICASLRYRTIGMPHNEFVCHCSFCQRASGSAFQIPACFLRDNVEFVAGTIGASRTSVQRARTCSQASVLRMMRNEGRMDGRRSAGPLGHMCRDVRYDPNWFNLSARIFTESVVKRMAFPPNVKVFRKHTVKEALPSRRCRSPSRT